jgi:hypothetical protein
MATFAQSIEVKLAVDTTAAFDALKRVESKMAQVFGAVSGGSSYQAKSIETVQAVTKVVEQQTNKLQQFASKIGGVFSAINFDNVKAKAATMTNTIKSAVSNIPILKIDQESQWIKADAAAKRYNVSLGTIGKWYHRSPDANLKMIEKTTGGLFGRSRLNVPALPVAGKEDYFNVPTAQADRFYNKMQLIDRVIYSALTQADSKANLVVARVDKIRMKLQEAIKPALVLAQKFSEIGKQTLTKGIESLENKAKQHENTLHKIFNAYIKIYSAPIKFAGKMWNFFTKPKEQKPTIDPREQAMQQGMSAISGMGNLAGATNNINVVINEVKKLEKEAKKTAGAMNYLKNALVLP